MWFPIRTAFPTVEWSSFVVSACRKSCQRGNVDLSELLRNFWRCKRSQKMRGEGFGALLRQTSFAGPISEWLALGAESTAQMQCNNAALPSHSPEIPWLTAKAEKDISESGLMQAEHSCRQQGQAKGTSEFILRPFLMSPVSRVKAEHRSVCSAEVLENHRRTVTALLSLATSASQRVFAWLKFDCLRLSVDNVE